MLMNKDAWVGGQDGLTLEVWMELNVARRQVAQ